MITSSDIWEGINGIAQLSMAVAVGLGVYVAHRQLTAWRLERRDVRRSQVAEELIAICLNVDDAFKEIRNPISSIPIEKAQDKLYHFQQRYERIVKHNELFRELRNAQIRARAVIGEKQVDEAVEELFSARAKVATAIEILADYAREGETPHDHSTREHIKDLRSSITSAGGESDLLGKKIRAAVQSVEEQLTPIARLENKR